MNTLKILLILSLLPLSSYFSTQDNTKTILSSGKWYANSIQYGENIIGIPDKELGKHWIHFGENNKYKDYSTKNEIGTWKYNAKDNSITISIDGKLSIKKIIHIDENELIFSTVIGEDQLITFLNKL